MRRLPTESITALHQAALAAGLDRDTLLAGIDRVLVAKIDLARSPSDQIYRDLHQLNEIPRGDDGADPLEQWLRSALALSSALGEAKVFEEQLARLEAASEVVPEAGPGAGARNLPVPARGGAAGRWTGTLQQRARVEAALSAVPQRDWTPEPHVCLSCGYDGVMTSRLRATRTTAILIAAGVFVLLVPLREVLRMAGIAVDKGTPAMTTLSVAGFFATVAAYLVARRVLASREGRRAFCPFCASVVPLS